MFSSYLKVIETGMCYTIFNSNLWNELSGLNFITNKLRNRLGDEFIDDMILGFLENNLINKFWIMKTWEKTFLIHSEIWDVDQQITRLVEYATCEYILMIIWWSDKYFNILILDIKEHIIFTKIIIVAQ